MLIYRQSPLPPHRINVMSIDITSEALAAYEAGESGYIQDAFPQLTADEREFIKTGITPGEWEAMF